MLRPIPRRIMTNQAILRTVNSTDRYGAPTFTDIPLEKVHIQPTHSVRISTTNKEVVLNATLFFDPRVSKPAINWQEYQTNADLENSRMKVVTGGMTYTVVGIDLVPDDEGKLHHVEVALV